LPSSLSSYGSWEFSGISALLASKRSGNELDKGEKIPAISSFIESELERWEDSEIAKSIVASHSNGLDQFFRESIKEVWEN
jgi:hypothetical protein